MIIQEGGTWLYPLLPSHLVATMLCTHKAIPNMYKASSLYEGISYYKYVFNPNEWCKKKNYSQLSIIITHTQ